VSNSLTLDIFETDEPVDAMTIYDLSVRRAPRAQLQLFTDFPSHAKASTQMP
jgi:hypothetical protein